MFSLNPHQLSMESSLNLQEATCYLPKFNLQFENIHARASLTDQSVFIDIQNTVSEQVFFEGKVLLDLNDMDAIELEISTNRVEGSFDVQGRSYSVDVRLSTEGDFDPELANALQLLAAPVDGGYQLTFSSEF